MDACISYRTASTWQRDQRTQTFVHSRTALGPSRGESVLVPLERHKPGLGDYGSGVQ